MFRSVLVTGLICAAWASSAPAAADWKIIVTHSGGADPTTEGFIVSGAGDNDFPGTPVVSGGVSAWNINDTSAVAGVNQTYSRNLGGPPGLTTQQAAAIEAQGWRLKWTVQAVSEAAASTRYIDVSLKLADNIRYNVWLGRTGDSVQIFGVGASSSETFDVTLPTAGAGFHTIEMVKPAGTTQASIYFNGELLGTYGGFLDTGGIRHLTFGSNANGVGESNWAFVQFSIPEPASAVMVTPVALLARRVRRR